MASFYVIILVMVGVLIAQLIGGNLNKIPLAFIQIAIGIGLSFIPLLNHFEMEPKLFLLVIIAPLMFNDSQNINLKSILRHFKSTFTLAVILAVLTIVLIGFVVNWRVAVFTLPLAIALGSIVAPTDAVAVKSVTATTVMPKHVMQSLEYESLFNDASGLVIFDLALSVIMTNEFSFSEGLSNFAYVFFGGLLVGLVAGLIIVNLRAQLMAKEITDTGVMIPLSILTPFAVYMLAEHLGVSGILGVVATGMVQAFFHTRLRLTSTRMQVVNTEIWDIISDILNGFVFILLGVMLPTVMVQMYNVSPQLMPMSFTVALLIYVLMVAIRYLFVRLNLADQHWPKDAKGLDAILFGLGGVHGTITLAMALSLPLTLHGAAFPYRDEIIFIAANVILISLLVPAVVFPRILPAKVESVTLDELQAKREEMIQFSLHRLKETGIDNTIQSAVSDNLLTQNGFKEGNREEIQRLLEGVNEVSTDTIMNAIDEGNLPKSAIKVLRQSLRHTSSKQKITVKTFKHAFKVWRHRVHKRRYLKLKDKYKGRRVEKFKQREPERYQKISDRIELTKQVQAAVEAATQQYLEAQTTEDNLTEINTVYSAYQVRWRQFNRTREGADVQLDDAQLHEAYVQAFQFEYQYVTDSLNAGIINNALAKKLQEVISSSEMVQFSSGNLSDED
ncbi:sodium:proton antiporter [Periweissella cryptocerci]|uniref:Sodium:proton antiporter n=1 Tax=Periweissella cryptocerci TaxID=2506420 RepID=A0A4P6YX71_9LACO|nr:sodium:proton antiporter [Periweissella cryptocerci]QBO37353.1 sodium:proton antiporter [Periweissella cryptocerci]